MNVDKQTSYLRDSALNGLVSGNDDQGRISNLIDIDDSGRNQ